MGVLCLVGGKQWQTTLKKLPRMQRIRAIPVAWLSSVLCPNRPKGLNTYNNDNNIIGWRIIVKITTVGDCELFGCRCGDVNSVNLTLYSTVWFINTTPDVPPGLLHFFRQSCWTNFAICHIFHNWSVIVFVCVSSYEGHMWFQWVVK